MFYNRRYNMIANQRKTSYYFTACDRHFFLCYSSLIFQIGWVPSHLTSNIAQLLHDNFLKQLDWKGGRFLQSKSYEIKLERLYYHIMKKGIELYKRYLRLSFPMDFCNILYFAQSIPPPMVVYFISYSISCSNFSQCSSFYSCISTYVCIYIIRRRNKSNINLSWFNY